MRRMAFLVAMVSAAAGFWLGDRGRVPVPAIEIRLPEPPKEYEVPVQKRTRAAVLDVPSRSPWIHAGDHVDVVGVFTDPQTNELVAVTLLQNVLISGVAKVDDRMRLTALLLPEEAELTLLAQRLGTVDVTLRNPDDVDVLEERGRATVNTLLSGERARLLHQKRYSSISCLLRSGTSK